jgi:hypothetical protein
MSAFCWLQGQAITLTPGSRATVIPYCEEAARTQGMIPSYLAGSGDTLFRNGFDSP